MPPSLTLIRPDDWHLHVRDGALMAAVLPFSAAVFGRAIIMPNLDPPITTAALAQSYRSRIVAALPQGSSFQPLMTCYLTDDTRAEDVRRGVKSGVFTAAKLYPARATTNSAFGVTDIGRLDGVFAAMAACGLPLLIHGEVSDADVDIFDRESVFIERELAPLLTRHPTLRIVLEHITTARAVAFVRAVNAADAKAPRAPRLAATLTAHHLLLNRNDLLAGGVRPHLYCLPIVKRETDRLALIEAATSAEPWFFLGTDSAPHPASAKECACGKAGIFTAPTAMALYAEVFAARGALPRLEAFASLNGPRFYGLAPNKGHITLDNTPTPVPTSIEVTPPHEAIHPFRAGGSVAWRVRDG